jgi:hypothetical protein
MEKKVHFRRILTFMEKKGILVPISAVTKKL